MVRLCVAGGCLSAENRDTILEAERRYASGDIAGASALCCDLLSRNPRDPAVLTLLALIAQDTGDLDTSLRFFDAVVAVKPGDIGALYNRSVLLRKLGRNDEALQAAREATALAPNMGEAWDMAAQILKEQGKVDAAIACHARAIMLQPKNARFHGNYAITLFMPEHLPAAYNAARLAAALDPAWPPMSLGNILKSMGHPEQAAECFARVAALRPDFPEASASEAMSRLQMGDMEQGWKLWERRPDFDKSLNALPLWQGQKIAHLFLYEDQGMGDAIQFARYIPMLKDRAQRVTLRIRAPLRNLIGENFTGINLISENDPAPACDARCRLSSLPFLFATRLDNVPATPYLTASAERKTFWQNKLSALPAPRIGLVWAGNAQFRSDSVRSLAFSRLLPFVEKRAAHFISLQKDRADSAAASAAGVFDAAPELRDFADTAALIAACDLIISADTAVAHLAGALGKPVWILLPFDADWRWLIGRGDSPWYQTARLFRQKKPGDWNGVLENLAAEIEKFAGGDSAVLTPPAWRGETLRRNPDALSLPS